MINASTPKNYMEKQNRPASADECGESCLMCWKCAERQRLTYRHPAGKIWLKACKTEEECDGECFYCYGKLMERALEKLAAYEETGLTPEEVRALTLK
ncbi:MAG: hypothetical protein SPG80_01025 [Candidatus Ventricola sp.]|nr:hypothetical protein [Candidatus Ventricola sp.]